MKATDFRIGNLVECDGNILEVVRISKEVINYETLIKSNGLQTNSGRKIPIKITQEWLVNLGFTIENKPNGDIEYSYKEYRYRLIYKENYDGYLFCDDDTVLRDLDYIHELQNIYFALIGIELKLKNDLKIMEYKIIKGDKFLCLENYIMDNGTIAYTNGKVYECEIDNCITDDQKDKRHKMDGQDDFFDYFKLINSQLNND